MVLLILWIYSKEWFFEKKVWKMCLSIEIWNKKFIIYLFLYVNSILMEIYIKDDIYGHAQGEGES